MQSPMRRVITRNLSFKYSRKQRHLSRTTYSTLKRIRSSQEGMGRLIPPQGSPSSRRTSMPLSPRMILPGLTMWGDPWTGCPLWKQVPLSLSLKVMTCFRWMHSNIRTTMPADNLFISSIAIRRPEVMMTSWRCKISRIATTTTSSVGCRLHLLTFSSNTSTTTSRIMNRRKNSYRTSFSSSRYSPQPGESKTWREAPTKKKRAFTSKITW